ncbi:hypothetical protein [Candidatus Cyanaurora vandensis]|uniref:hypothetical protein n=1 Tax=Candidatus Cyanaurora vandensis TaxID=2714958 RepID=UPI00257D7892|nr:hypothetical protein [Candidatus Cyanaurora vandensis]
MLRDWLPYFSALVLGSILLRLLWDLVCWFRQMKQVVQRNLAIPCHRCRYANPDFNYLKCTVHPVTAFSEAAIDCGDFRDQAHTSPYNPNKSSR